ncbi:hypothetical protein Tco_1219952 [Tanacetum coccineum]
MVSDTSGMEPDTQLNSEDLGKGSLDTFLPVCHEKEAGQANESTQKKWSFQPFNESKVRDDLSWEFESTDNVFPHKFFDLIASDGCNRFCFDPPCEVVNSYYQELEFSRFFRERSGYVNFPFVEWPWRRDWGWLLLRTP